MPSMCSLIAGNRSSRCTARVGRLRGSTGLPQSEHVLKGVHNLKHTFGRRLRAARVPLEARRVLLGHTNRDITTHYSAPELAELVQAAERVCERQDGLVILGSVR